MIVVTQFRTRTFSWTCDLPVISWNFRLTCDLQNYILVVNSVVGLSQPIHGFHLLLHSSNAHTPVYHHLLMSGSPQFWTNPLICQQESSDHRPSVLCMRKPLKYFACSAVNTTDRCLGICRRLLYVLETTALANQVLNLVLWISHLKSFFHGAAAKKCNAMCWWFREF